MKKHWCHIEIEVCPVCFRERQTRERRFTRRPKRWNKRHRIIDRYDWCDG